MRPIWGVRAEPKSVYVGLGSTSRTSRTGLYRKVIFHITRNVADLP
jgi:hypothetical protein